jgi:crotonobetainyl-CoA:carnitine CoA-transferase CaiB-like acyl-CoA transferase
MSGPLEGIKVVDCSWWLQGPMVAAFLGDMGAEVIKVEERVKGDPMRGVIEAHFPQYQRHSHFEAINRNKRGITLELRKQEGREIVYKLIEKADVFINNFRSQAVKRLALDYETLSGLNPRLVYAQASGWGLKGPERDKGAYDVAAAARSGFMYILGKTEELPRRPPSALCDMAGALCLSIGILAALQARERLGRGQMVHCSLFGSSIALLAHSLTYSLGLGVDQPMPSRTDTVNPLYNFYKCADGEWIFLIMPQFDRYWRSFCEAIGTRELEKDPRFENLSAVIDHNRELILILDRIFATKPREEWMRTFSERDILHAPIQKPLDLVTDPQAIANDYIMEFDHPIYGREKVVGPPYSFSETPLPPRRPSPDFGQHTEEVLLELGYSWDDIARLKEQEVI